MTAGWLLLSNTVVFWTIFKCLFGGFNCTTSDDMNIDRQLRYVQLFEDVLEVISIYHFNLFKLSL